MAFAHITTDPDHGGRLTDDSTLTIDGVTTAVPTRVQRGGRLAPSRINRALRDAGYRPATDYYSDIVTYDGYITIAVVPL